METDVLEKPEAAAGDGDRTGPFSFPVPIVGPRNSVAAATRGRRQPANTLLLLTAAAALASVAASGVLAARNAELRKDVSQAAAWKEAATDSLRLARDYQNLLGEVFDLQQEVRARQTGVVPPMPALWPQGAGISALLGARVIPKPYRFEPTEPERELARAELMRYPGTIPHVHLYALKDVEKSGALAELAQRGVRVEIRGGEQAGPTNTIIFGSEVPSRDAVNIAYRLIASGILVRRIRQTAEPERRRVIELTHARQASDWPELTVSELGRFANAQPR